jgi:hypothetical protein
MKCKSYHIYQPKVVIDSSLSFFHSQEVEWGKMFDWGRGDKFFFSSNIFSFLQVEQREKCKISITFGTENGDVSIESGRHLIRSL